LLGPIIWELNVQLISLWFVPLQDDELKKAAEHARVNNPDKLPPIRNSSNLQPRKVQSGPSTVELEKKSQVKEPTCNKKRLNYSYDYFKEWDKYDVDTELKRLEEEEKHLEEERQKCPKTADPGADVHSDQTYKIEAMTPLEKRVAAQREKEKGNECMKCGETNAAVAYYSKSLELVPGDHLVLGNRAQAYLAIHCYMQAELDCDKALSIEPTYTKARYRRAVARKEQGNWEGSLKDLDIVLIENSAHTQASKLRTECVKRIEAKKKEDEEKRKEEEERQRYESAPRHKIAIQEVEGEDDDDDGMDKTALDQAREAVRLKRDAEDKLLRKEAAQRKKDEGNEAFKKKDLQAAARLYSEAINLYPSDDKDSYVALSNRALVYLQQEKFDEAEIDCNKAIECNPKWAKAWHRRGVARAGLNRRVDALQDLEKALMLEPDSKQTLEEIRKLRGGKKTEASHSDFSFPKGFSNNENKQFSGRPSIVELGSEDYQDNQGDMKSNQRTNVIRESENGDGRPKLQKSHGLGENKFSRVEIIEDEEEDDKANQGHDSADLNISSRMNRIQIIEDDDSDDDDDQKKANVKSAVQVTLNTPADSGLLPAFDGQDEEGEVLDDDCTFTNASGTSVQDGCPIRVCVEEDSDDDMPHDAPNKIDGHTGMVRVDVEEDSDSDDDLTQDDMPTCVEDSAAVPPYDGQQEILSSEREVLKPKQEILCHSSVTDVQNPIQPTAVALWGEGEGRNFEAVQAARGVKEQGDQLMRQGMFEAAAERYSAALDALGDGEDLVQERRVCFSNRAGCRLQLRDYGSVIADCGEVLAVDGCDVKALVRRGLAYEGLEKLSKASADVRAALSIEYATAGAGGRLSNLGQMARQCLERCHRACPQVCPLTIPIQPPVPTQSKVYTSSGQVSGRGLELGKSGVIAEPVKAALEEVPSNTKSSSDLRCNLGSSCKSTVNSVPRKDDQPVSVSSDPEPPSVRERRIEAETLKSKGNEAFESGR
jgi:tetratricopeptide (TPR) repeat protein